MTKYVAVINTPGYVPWDDDPPIFDSPREAWAYLRDERMRQEDEVDVLYDEAGDTAYSETFQELDGWAKAEPSATGTIYGPTPGYDGDHDLGVAYSVVIAEEEA